MNFFQRILTKIDLELIFLSVALIALALSDPQKEHFDLCLFKIIGFDHCPGCGLGHSISWLFRGNIKASIDCHFMGIPAVFIMLHRIYQILKVKRLRKNNYTNLYKQI